jgi:hypothetical protein
MSSFSRYSPSSSSIPVLTEQALTHWIPGPGDLEQIHVGEFRRLLKRQGLDLTDAATRRGLIRRWCLGGWGEQPYGEHDKGAWGEPRQTRHRASAQKRARCLQILWDAEEADTTAPLIDANTTMAYYLLAITWYPDNVDTAKAPMHSDFRHMVEVAFRCTELRRTATLAPSQHEQEKAQAGLHLIAQEQARFPAFRPDVPAARYVSRAAQTLMAKDDQGVRLLWSWLDKVMGPETPQAGEAVWTLATQSSPGNPHRDDWVQALTQTPLAPIADAPLPALLDRWEKGMYASDARHALLTQMKTHYAALRLAQGRHEDAQTETPNPQRRRRWRT